MRLAVVEPRLERKDALAGRWEHLRGFENLRRAVEDAQPLQSRGGQDHRIVLPVVDLSDSRVDVPAYIADLDVRA